MSKQTKIEIMVNPAVSEKANNKALSYQYNINNCPKGSDKGVEDSYCSISQAGKTDSNIKFSLKNQAYKAIQDSCKQSIKSVADTAAAAPAVEGETQAVSADKSLYCAAYAEKEQKAASFELKNIVSKQNGVYLAASIDKFTYAPNTHTMGALCGNNTFTELSTLGTIAMLDLIHNDGVDPQAKLLFDSLKPCDIIAFDDGCDDIINAMSMQDLLHDAKFSADGNLSS